MLPQREPGDKNDVNASARGPFYPHHEVPRRRVAVLDRCPGRAAPGAAATNAGLAPGAGTIPAGWRYPAAGAQPDRAGRTAAPAFGIRTAGQPRRAARAVGT